jgi:hypothetical protein
MLCKYFLFDLFMKFNRQQELTRFLKTFTCRILFDHKEL